MLTSPHVHEMSALHGLLSAPVDSNRLSPVVYALSLSVIRALSLVSLASYLSFSFSSEKFHSTPYGSFLCGLILFRLVWSCIRSYHGPVVAPVCTWSHEQVSHGWCGFLSGFIHHRWWFTNLSTFSFRCCVNLLWVIQWL